LFPVLVGGLCFKYNTCITIGIKNARKQVNRTRKINQNKVGSTSKGTSRPFLLLLPVIGLQSLVGYDSTCDRLHYFISIDIYIYKPLNFLVLRHSTMYHHLPFSNEGETTIEGRKIVTKTVFRLVVDEEVSFVPAGRDTVRICTFDSASMRNAFIPIPVVPVMIDCLFVFFVIIIIIIFFYKSFKERQRRPLIFLSFLAASHCRLFLFH